MKTTTDDAKNWYDRLFLQVAVFALYSKECQQYAGDVASGAIDSPKTVRVRFDVGKHGLHGLWAGNPPVSANNVLQLYAACVKSIAEGLLDNDFAVYLYGKDTIGCAEVLVKVNASLSRFMAYFAAIGEAKVEVPQAKSAPLVCGWSD